LNGLSESVNGLSVHLFNQRAPWYEELLDVADEIAECSVDESFDDEDEDMGRYFSKN